MPSFERVPNRVDKLRAARQSAASKRTRLAILALVAAALLCALLPLGAFAQSLPLPQPQLTNSAAHAWDTARVIQLGAITCSDGHRATLLDLPGAPGKFILNFNGTTMLFEAVASQTGAVRLEDKARGLVWIQLSAKSMLLDQRAGKRLADDCTTYAQQTFAATNRVPTLFD